MNQLYSPLQLHHSKRENCCGQSAVPLPSAQVNLRQLALSPPTLNMHKSRMEHEDIHDSSLWIMENNTLKVYHERRVLGSQESLVQKSVEALAGGSSTVEDGKEKKNTSGGDPKICAPKVGKVNEGSLEEK